MNPGRSIFHAHEQKYPARFQLVAAMNPSPTGHYQGNHNRCTPEQTLRYLNRLSGPFDPLRSLTGDPITAPRNFEVNGSAGESSTTVKQRVMAARERQFKRQNKLNAWLDSPEIRQYCKLESEDAMWLEETLIHLGLSIRAWQRLLKVARTIADIDQSDIITRQHLQEAVSYRAIDLFAHPFAKTTDIKKGHFALFINRQNRCSLQHLQPAVYRRKGCENVLDA